MLQLLGTLAALYLPSLNADIIDNGVAKGDTTYILQVGAVMLAVTLRADRLLDRRGVLRRAHARWASAATLRAAIFHRVGALLRARGHARSAPRR